MNCKVCGAESGKYPLCRNCNAKKEAGYIIKCPKCNTWHYAVQPCPVSVSCPPGKFLYEPRKALISKSEQAFFAAIKSSVPDGYCVFPQINLASFIDRTDDARFRNELYRNVDFLLTDSEYQPKIVIEINDQTHLTPDRKERDEKVQKICEEAGIPIIKLWTSYGVNPEYIRTKITETLSKMPVERIHHFNQPEPTQNASTSKDSVQQPSATTQHQDNSNQGGCYVATCVYGSYDCPQVWTLRRYRDRTLASTWYGNAFIKLYYATSPTLVRLFGAKTWFCSFFKRILDPFVSKLQAKGFDSSPYNDQ